jgi:D-amino-acid oxidase
VTEVLIVGCGVSGLTCGVRLLEAGYRVRIWARDLPPRTTSNVAAAIWYPYRAFPLERVGAWGAQTFAELVRLAAQPDTGVRSRSGIEIFPQPVGDPWWRDTVTMFRRARPEELPQGYADGYVLEVPIIEMPIYLGYLTRRFQALGGDIEVCVLASIGEALDACDLVVNCAGLGARELVGDTSLFAIRGQVVRVAQVGIERFTLDDYGPRGLTYIVPRSNDIILGGTDQEGDERLEPDPATAEAIVDRCAALEPRLRDAEILEHRVGLRPGRPAVRLEAVRPATGKLVLHNYGHGGAGVTLSWGCADEVLSILRNV